MIRSHGSRLRTKPAQATTDKYKFTQIEINNQSVFICGSNCHSRNVVNGDDTNRIQSIRCISTTSICRACCYYVLSRLGFVSGWAFLMIRASYRPETTMSFTDEIHYAAFRAAFVLTLDCMLRESLALQHAVARPGGFRQ